MNKKQEQLGMNPSTAQQRLLRDLLFFYSQKLGIKCCRCKEFLTRETFSIEHIKPWLNSADPKGLFFDLENVSLSHLSCNLVAANHQTGRQPIEQIREKNKLKMRVKYSYENRRHKYLTTGH